MVARWLIAAVAALLCVAGPAQAHLASDSYLRVEIGGAGQISGQWDVALRDLDVAVGLDANQDGKITWGEVRAKAQQIQAYTFGHLRLARAGAACRVTPTGLQIDYHAGTAYAVFPFSAECPATGELSLHYGLLFDLDPSHRGLLTVIEDGQIRTEVLTPEHADVTLDSGPVSLAEALQQFLQLGLDHILLGYDHLLFIAVLLITAAFRRFGSAEWVAIDGLGRVLIETTKTLTAFTIAHAIVLTIAVLTTVNVPARLVDPAVALTIILAAIDNIWPILPSLRWRVAFLFGIVHGLSFASGLGPMRLPPLRLGLALACFNTGVELGQIALALLLLPIVYSSRHEITYHRLVLPGLSIVAALLGGLWLVDRVFGLGLI